MANRERTPGHLMGMALACAASGAFVCIAAWALGAFAVWQAAAGFVASLAVGFAVATPWARDMAELAARARSIGEEEPDPQPAARRTVLGVEIARALIESRRRVNRMQRALEERSNTGERVLDAAPEPLIVIDLRLMITHANFAAERVFGADLPGRSLVDAIRSTELIDAVDAVVTEAEPEATVDFDFAANGRRSFRAIIGRLEKIGGGGEAAVIALQDLTAIRRIEEMRADFVANASHELRTPLASLVGFIETLEGPARDDAEARSRFLAIMHDQARRMTRLVEDLLSLSRIELDEHAPPGATEDLARLIAAVIDEVRPIARGRDVVVELDCDTSFPAVAGDGDLLQQVFRNLIENAIRYGKEGGKVRIAARMVEGEARIAVTDEGEGIAAEHISRLTERFYRVDVARSRTLGGTGLGLAIVKHILNRCGGKLLISSRIGYGSEFTVVLPLADQADLVA